MFPSDEEYISSEDFQRNQKILHFSDGVMENFSDSESELDAEDKMATSINVVS